MCWSCKALNKYISVQSSLLSSIISHFNVKTCLIFTYLFKTKRAVAFWTFCNGFFIYLEVLSNKTLQQSDFESIRNSSSCFHTGEGVYILSFYNTDNVAKHFLLILLIWSIVATRSFYAFTNSNCFSTHLIFRFFISSNLWQVFI